jgi:hypothetical protein
MSSREKYIDPDPAKLQFAIIPVVTPPTNAIAHGSLNAVMEHVGDSEALRQVRSDAVSAATDARASIADAIARTDAIARRETDVSARERACSAREAAVRDAIADWRAVADATRAALKARRQDEEEQQELETNLPGGELHDLPPKAQDPDEPDPIGDQGDLPEELVIPEFGNYPTLEDPASPQVPQPTSVSLMSEDDDDVA